LFDVDAPDARTPWHAVKGKNARYHVVTSVSSHRRRRLVSNKPFPFFDYIRFLFSIAPLRCSRWTIDPTCSRIAARKIASGIEAFGRDHPSCNFLGAQQLSLAVRSAARQNHGSSSLPW
jgi:hypothetical protein